MIIWITGISASGKSTMYYKVLSRLGVGYKNMNDCIPFYTFNDIITIGRYSQSGKTLNGTDGVMVSKDRFKRFIDTEYQNYRHILIEGNKFTTEEVLDHLLKYDLKVFHLTASLEETLVRSRKRNTGFDNNKITLQFSKNHIKRYERLYNKTKYKKNIEIRPNLNIKDSNNTADEIFRILDPKLNQRRLFDFE